MIDLVPETGWSCDTITSKLLFSSDLSQDCIDLFEDDSTYVSFQMDSGSLCEEELIEVFLYAELADDTSVQATFSLGTLYLEIIDDTVNTVNTGNNVNSGNNVNTGNTVDTGDTETLTDILTDLDKLLDSLLEDEGEEDEEEENEE